MKLFNTNWKLTLSVLLIELIKIVICLYILFKGWISGKEFGEIIILFGVANMFIFGFFIGHFIYPNSTSAEVENIELKKEQTKSRLRAFIIMIFGFLAFLIAFILYLKNIIVESKDLINVIKIIESVYLAFLGLIIKKVYK